MESRENNQIESLVKGLNNLQRNKYPGRDELFIFSSQFLPVNAASMKLFKQAELVLWHVKSSPQGVIKKRILTVRKVDRFEDPVIKDFVKEALEQEFILQFLDWLSSNGLQKVMEDGTQ